MTNSLRRVIILIIVLPFLLFASVALFYEQHMTIVYEFGRPTFLHYLSTGEFLIGGHVYVELAYPFVISAFLVTPLGRKGVLVINGLVLSFLVITFGPIWGNDFHPAGVPAASLLLLMVELFLLFSQRVKDTYKRGGTAHN